MKIRLKNIHSRLRGIIRSAGVLADRRRVPVFAVGGLVRDCLLERPSLDLDLTVEGDGMAFAKSLAQELGAAYVPHQPFLTAVLTLPDGLIVDVVTARRESYARPGALPCVEASDLGDDLFRRDFTVNAMAFSINRSTFGMLHDPFGGLADLNSKKIRVLHHEAFIDDATRLLRAVRYESRLGFKMETATLALFKNAAAKHAWTTIKPQRYWAEMTKVLHESSAIISLRRLQALHALALPLFELDLTPRRIKEAQRVLKDNPALDPVLIWLMVLNDYHRHDDLAFASSHLGLTRADRQAIEQSLTIAQRLGALSVPQFSSSGVYHFLQGMDEAVLQLMKARAAGQARTRLMKYIKKDRNFKLMITGEDVKRMNIAEGINIKKILDEVTAHGIDKHVLTRAAQLKLAKELARQ